MVYVNALKKAAAFHFDGKRIAVMVSDQLRGRGSFRGDNLLSGRNGADQDFRGRTADRGVKALFPVIPQTKSAGTLLKIMGGNHDIRPRLELTSLILAQFIAVNLGGNNDVANRNVLHPTSHADEQSDAWLVMPQRPHRDRRGMNISGADFGNRHVPFFEAASKKTVPETVSSSQPSRCRNTARVSTSSAVRMTAVFFE